MARNKDGLKFFRNQPDYSVVNDLKFRIRNSLSNHPRLLQLARLLQHA